MNYADEGVFATFGENNSRDFEAMNKGVTPIFFYEPVPDDAASEREGRLVCRDMERVRLQIAGDPFTAAVHPVTDYDRQRFPDAYRHWKQSNEAQHIVGTPLKMWPPASPSLVKEAESVNIYSVENLAAVADVHIGRLSNGREWREKAISWLNVAKDSAAGTAYAAENLRLKERLAALETLVQNPAAIRAEPAIAETVGHDIAGTLTSGYDRSAMMKRVWAERKARQEAATLPSGS